MSERNSPLSVAECDRLRDLHADGLSVGQIVDRTDHGRTTVRRHVHDRCSHANEGGNWGGSQQIECPLCGAEVVSQNLSVHLPSCSGAETPPEAGATRGESA